MKAFLSYLLLFCLVFTTANGQINTDIDNLGNVVVGKELSYNPIQTTVPFLTISCARVHG